MTCVCDFDCNNVTRQSGLDFARLSNLCRAQHSSSDRLDISQGDKNGVHGSRPRLYPVVIQSNQQNSIQMSNLCRAQHSGGAKLHV